MSCMSWMNAVASLRPTTGVATASGFALPGDPELPHPLPQRVPVDPQQFRGLELIPSHPVEDRLQEGALRQGDDVLIQRAVLVAPAKKTPNPFSDPSPQIVSERDLREAMRRTWAYLEDVWAERTVMPIATAQDGGPTH